MAIPAFLKGKFTEEKDKKKDAKMTKGMTPKQKAEFEKKDKAHKKPKTMQEDKNMDAKIIKDVKKKPCSCGKCAACKKKKAAKK